jgi:hypothetical protein
MGKARQYRQAITIRFDDADNELQQWLGQFAQDQTMTKIVKLALYQLAGLQPTEGLLASLPSVQAQQGDYRPFHEVVPAPQEAAYDALATVMQELASLREAVVGRAPQTISQHGEPNEERNSEVRSDSRRRRQKPKPTPVEAWPMPEASERAEIPSEPVLGASSGLDMSRPRKRSGPPLAPATPVAPTVPELDADEARRKLLASIKAYGKEFHRGRST